MLKSILNHLLIFAALAVLMSSLTSCGGVNNGNANAPANANANANANAGTGTASNYPPLASSLAEAKFELLDGSELKLTDQKGKVILANIWGIWCGPCRAEMPELVALQDRYRDKNFEIIGINTGQDDTGAELESVDAIKKFAEKMKLNYTLARSPDPEALKAYYAVTKQNVVPQSILMDRQGRLRGVFSGYGPNVSQKLQETLEKVLNEE